MKQIKKIVILVYIASIFSACTDNDNPIVINEEELITTVRATLVPQNGGASVTLESIDLDGDGPNEPVISVSGDFSQNTTYTGNLLILNDTETPADNITLEILEEDEEHQFFFSSTNNIATTTYNDQDSNGNPIGVEFSLLTGNSGYGAFTITLRHEPNKSGMNVNTGDITNAGGETDVQVIFDITVN
tara:strand:+ start:3560 stop:4123 length:564 start_codon:yes stop_codon:yes gene_type:complete